MHDDSFRTGEGLRLIKRNRRCSFCRCSNRRGLFCLFNKLLVDNIQDHIGFDRFLRYCDDFLDLRRFRFNSWCRRCFNLNSNRLRHDGRFNSHFCDSCYSGLWCRLGDNWLRDRSNWYFFNFLLVPLDSAELRNDGFNCWSRALWCFCDDSGNRLCRS